MSALAIPDPPPAGEYPVVRVCAEIAEWARCTDDVSAIKDAKIRLEAIDTYLERTSNAGRAEVAGTMRRLEVRIGQLIGDAEIGSHSSATEGASLTKGLRA